MNSFLGVRRGRASESLGIRRAATRWSRRRCEGVEGNSTTVLTQWRILKIQASLTAHWHDKGADWRGLAYTPAHHRSRLSDSVKNGNAHLGAGRGGRRGGRGERERGGGVARGTHILYE